MCSVMSDSLRTHGLKSTGLEGTSHFQVLSLGAEMAEGGVAPFSCSASTELGPLSKHTVSVGPAICRKAPGGKEPYFFCYPDI